MKQIRTIIQSGTGGALLGFFLGVFLAAIPATVFGLLRNQYALGLEGAMLGGAVGGITGAIYGLSVAWSEFPAQPLPAPDRRNFFSVR